jgi:hypothetical protein
MHGRYIAIIIMDSVAEFVAISVSANDIRAAQSNGNIIAVKGGDY